MPHPSAPNEGASALPLTVPRFRRRPGFLKYPALYWMALPGVLYYIVFKYVPMAGIVIAFQNFNIFKGFTGSPFVGWQHFETLFHSRDFIRLFTNTLLINAYDLLFGFTAPILLALLLNEVTHTVFKRTVQSLLYVPHFMSWVVIGGLFTSSVLSPETGILNAVIKALGGDPIYFLVENKYIRSVIIGSGIYKEVGWGTIIYLATLAGINPNLYEAASIDGAGRFRQLVHITLPSLLPIVTVLFLLQIGHFLDFGFDRIWVFMNGANQSHLDIFDTYVYRVGIMEGHYSYATAVGLFKSFVGLVLIVSFNKLSTRFSGQGLF